MKYGSAKIGMFVQPWGYDKTIAPYEIKAIFSDSHGRVLLDEVGGYGYDEEYCRKVNIKKDKPK
jgi:hypothetical protein